MNGILTSTIRQRGQLTLPKKARDIIPWLSKGSIVSVIVSINEIKVMPYQESLKTIVPWKNIWEKIALSRSLKGKRGNLSSYIFKDRSSH